MVLVKLPKPYCFYQVMIALTSSLRPASKAAVYFSYSYSSLGIMRYTHKFQILFWYSELDSLKLMMKLRSNARYFKIKKKNGCFTERIKDRDQDYEISRISLFEQIYYEPDRWVI